MSRVLCFRLRRGAVLGPGCARSMVTVSEWLGADYKTKGVKRVLSDRIKAGLEAASTQTMWNMDDVPNFEAVDEAHLDEAGKMLKRFLGTVLTDVEAESKAAVTKAGTGTPVSFSGTERMRLDEWVDGLVLSHKQPVVAPQKLSDREVSQLQTDLKTQGMPDESDLMWFELTRHTGRPAAPGDTEGGTYLGKASATKGGVAHRKAGEETYSKVLNEAVANEDFGRIERWNEQLVEVLDSSEHRYAGQASLLIMGMMQKLTSTLGRGKHALLYLQLQGTSSTSPLCGRWTTWSPASPSWWERPSLRSRSIGGRPTRRCSRPGGPSATARRMGGRWSQTHTARFSRPR